MAAMASIPALRARDKLHQEAIGMSDIYSDRAAGGDQAHDNAGAAATTGRCCTASDDEPLFTYRNLQQELLMALLGFCGDVFVDTAEGDDGGQDPLAPPPMQHPAACSVRLAPDIDWVEARDRAALARLAALGFHYKQARRFVEAERGAAPRSAYRQALCAGVTGGCSSLLWGAERRA